MRLSPYAIIKGTGHLPGPYTIPNVSSNVYCVVTNRTPATAMRGFGITAVDFSIECHMDRVAEAVAMNPVELRILNAYRDGDMKAHRRKAKNTALIECCQVAAGKAGLAISSDAAAQSSLIGGGIGERVAIPETTTDEEGKIGERRAGRVASTAPSPQGNGRIPAGQHGEAIVGAPVQNPDMQIDAERIGHRMGAPSNARTNIACDSADTTRSPGTTRGTTPRSRHCCGSSGFTAGACTLSTGQAVPTRHQTARHFALHLWFQETLRWLFTRAAGSPALTTLSV